MINIVIRLIKDIIGPRHEYRRDPLSTNRTAYKPLLTILRHTSKQPSRNLAKQRLPTTKWTTDWMSKDSEARPSEYDSLVTSIPAEIPWSWMQEDVAADSPGN